MYSVVVETTYQGHIRPIGTERSKRWMKYHDQGILPLIKRWRNDVRKKNRKGIITKSWHTRDEYNNEWKTKREWIDSYTLKKWIEEIKEVT